MKQYTPNHCMDPSLFNEIMDYRVHLKYCRDHDADYYAHLLADRELYNGPEVVEFYRDCLTASEAEFFKMAGEYQPY